MLFEGDLVHRFLAPFEGSALGVVNLDESIERWHQGDSKSIPNRLDAPQHSGR